MKYKGHEIKKFDKRDPLVADGSYKAGYYVYRGHYGVGNFEGAYETLKEAKDSIDETPYQRWQRTYPKRNPQGRHIMKRSANPRKSAGSKWGVYCRGTLAYVSSAKPDCTKAKTKLKRAGFGVCTVKKVGPNPVSGKVPVVGWRETFKKASRVVAGHSKKNPSYDYKDPRFHLHPQEPPYRATLLKHGYVYSHKTPIHRQDGSTYEHFTFKHRDNRDVNVGTWVGSDGTPRWSGSKGGSGTQHTGKGAAALSKYLTGRAKRLGLAKNPGPTRGISSRAVSGRMGRKISQFSPSRKYGGRSAGIGTRAVVKGGRLRNPVPKWTGASHVYSQLQKGLAEMALKGHATAAVKGGRGGSRIISSGTVSQEMRDVISEMDKGNEEKLKWRVHWMRTYGYLKNPKSNPRRRNAASVLRRRSNPVRRTGASGFGAVVAEVTDKSGRLIGKVKWTGAANKTQRYAWEVVDTVAGRYSGYSSTESGAIKKIKGNWSAYLKKFGKPEDSPFYRKRNSRRTARSSNPRKGYVVQVGNSVAWVGKLASDATKVIRKLMAAGFKSVKGFEAKLLGAKPGWRKQYVKASRSTTSRRSNPAKTKTYDYYELKTGGYGSDRLIASYKASSRSIADKYFKSSFPRVRRYKVVVRTSNPSLAAKGGRRSKNPTRVIIIAPSQLKRAIYKAQQHADRTGNSVAIVDKTAKSRSLRVLRVVHPK